MARPKKAKRNPKQASAAAALDDIQSLADRLVAWISDNPMIVLGSAVAILLVGGGIGLTHSLVESSRSDASAALDDVERDYRVAMGAGPEDLRVSEPANPETARRVREEYVERYREVARKYAGSAAGSLASLDEGVLLEALGRTDEALSTWQAAADELGSQGPVAALLELRIAGAHEDAEHWTEAAEAYEKAASIQDFPLRYSALADAARCYAEAGDVDRALEAFSRVEAEAPDVHLPDHVSTRLRELQAAQHLN